MLICMLIEASQSSWKFCLILDAILMLSLLIREEYQMTELLIWPPSPLWSCWRLKLDCSSLLITLLASRSDLTVSSSTNS